jgi:hypothetical protein
MNAYPAETVNGTRLALIERVTVDDIQVGDQVARARTHTFREVAYIHENPSTRWLTYGPDPRRIDARYNPEGDVGRDRPRRTAQWWRIVPED